MDSFKSIRVIDPENNTSNHYNVFKLQWILEFVGSKKWESPGLSAKVFESINGNRYKENTIHRKDLVDRIFTFLRENSAKMYFRIRKEDVYVACRIQDTGQPLIILLGGTSGCGKSTLSFMIANMLGIHKILSTDSLRHILRHYMQKEGHPYLWTSSYNVAEASGNGASSYLDREKKVVNGYQQQSKLVMKEVEAIVRLYGETRKSIIIEGVHISLEESRKLADLYDFVIPLVIYIKKRSRHAERFATRAKYMTLNPSNNKYMYHFDSIRTIQDYICREARIHKVPLINNTNIDGSISVIHRALLNTLSVFYHEKDKNRDVKMGDVINREISKIKDKKPKKEEILKIIKSGKENTGTNKEDWCVSKTKV